MFIKTNLLDSNDVRNIGSETEDLIEEENNNEELVKKGRIFFNKSDMKLSDVMLEWMSC